MKPFLLQNSKYHYKSNDDFFYFVVDDIKFRRLQLSGAAMKLSSVQQISIRTHQLPFRITVFRL